MTSAIMAPTALAAENGKTEVSMGKIPVTRKSRNALLKAHKAHLKAQENDEDEGRLVKQPVMEKAYQASAKSIRDLAIVRL